MSLMLTEQVKTAGKSLVCKIKQKRIKPSFGMPLTRTQYLGIARRFSESKNRKLENIVA